MSDVPPFRLAVAFAVGFLAAVAVAGVLGARPVEDSDLVDMMTGDGE